MSITKYAPKLPLQKDTEDKYIFISDIKENIKQKLRMIVLTNPGEKLMDPFFGIGIRRYLFEPSNGIITVAAINGEKTFSIDEFTSEIATNISKQVSLYSSDINIIDVTSSLEENYLNLSIFYSYRTLLQDSLVIQITS